MRQTHLSLFSKETAVSRCSDSHGSEWPTVVSTYAAKDERGPRMLVGVAGVKEQGCWGSPAHCVHVN
jgi:hypothetical protein